MQANWDEMYPTQVGCFSHVSTGWKVRHSGETSHLGEVFISYKQPLKNFTQQTNTYTKSTTETLKQNVKSPKS